LARVAKVWQLKPHDRSAIAQLADSLQISAVAAQLLLNRGLADPLAARRFLESPLSGLHSPDQLPGVPQAVELLADAIASKKKICIYGDYDVDGVTGTAILLELLTILEVPVEFHIPHRMGEGYGLRSEALRQFAQEGTQVVVTVDCGISAIHEAEEARRLGLELIITDHHEILPTLPAATAIVHPRLPESRYPFGGLSGSGVAFKLAWALCQKISGGEKVSPRLREFLLDAVGLAALGLIADVVPLQDENRILVKHGLNRIQKSPSVGVRALLESAGLTPEKAIASDDVSFKLAPRLNSAGRLGCARLVVELLTTTDTRKARELAAYLDGQNKERQSLERRISTQARAKLEDPGLAKLPAIVLCDPEWHPGIIGIVAGRLADQFGKPTLIIAATGDPAAGSGRSIAGFALHEALAACSSVLHQHGGHAAAAGFRVSVAQVDRLREMFCEYTSAHFPTGVPRPTISLDAEVPLSALTFGLMNEIGRLEPFGASNPQPRFLVGGLEIVGEPRRIGNGERHLSFRVKQYGDTIRAVAFGMAERLDELMSAGGKCSVVFTPRINEWNGRRSVEIEVADFQAGSQAQLG
jgi:single-stranded-DNA-specific exonuclease